MIVKRFSRRLYPALWAATAQRRVRAQELWGRASSLPFRVVSAGVAHPREGVAHRWVRLHPRPSGPRRPSVARAARSFEVAGECVTALLARRRPEPVGTRWERCQAPFRGEKRARHRPFLQCHEPSKRLRSARAWRAPLQFVRRIARPGGRPVSAGPATVTAPDSDSGSPRPLNKKAPPRRAVKYQGGRELVRTDILRSEHR